MEKSYVTLERQVCPACGKEHDTGVLLLDPRLKPVFEMHTITGWGVCLECKKQIDDGRVVLVECNPEKSGNPSGNLKPEDAYRTGRVIYMKAEAFAGVFNISVPEKGVAFIEPAAFDKLALMGSEAENGTC